MSALHVSRLLATPVNPKAAERIRARFLWPKMDNDVEEYMRSCDTCQAVKGSRYREYGMLQLLEVPYTTRSSISMDFTTKATIEELVYMFLPGNMAII